MIPASYEMSSFFPKNSGRGLGQFLGQNCDAAFDLQMADRLEPCPSEWKPRVANRNAYCAAPKNAYNCRLLRPSNPPSVVGSMPDYLEICEQAARAGGQILL